MPKPVRSPSPQAGSQWGVRGEPAVDVGEPRTAWWYDAGGCTGSPGISLALSQVHQRRTGLLAVAVGKTVGASVAVCGWRLDGDSSGRGVVAQETYGVTVDGEPTGLQTSFGAIRLRGRVVVEANGVFPRSLLSSSLKVVTELLIASLGTGTDGRAVRADPWCRVGRAGGNELRDHPLVARC